MSEDNIGKEESYDTDSTLSTAKTDIKTQKKSIPEQRSDDEPDNIELNGVFHADIHSGKKLVDGSQKLHGVNKLKRRSWFSDMNIGNARLRSKTKSDGENDTSNAEQDVILHRRAPYLKPKTGETRRESDESRKDSTYMDIYGGRKFKSINGWTVALEIKCREIGTECATFKWLHNKNALLLGGKLTKTTLIAAILSSIGGISVLIDYIVTNYYQDVAWINPVMKLILFLLNLAVTIILIIQKTYDFVQKIEFHRGAERRHSWLFYNVQSQLQRHVKDRMAGNDYFTWITHELNSIADSNDIDDDVIKDFYNTFQDTKIPSLDTMNQLQVNLDEEEDSSSKKDNKGSSKSTKSSKSSDTSPPPSIHNMQLNTSVDSNSAPVTQSMPNLVDSPSTKSDTVIDMGGVGIPPGNIRRSSNLLHQNGRRSSFESNSQTSPQSSPSTKKGDYVRHFREQRDMNVLNLGSNTNMPRYTVDQGHKNMHNPELMAYELKRMGISED